MVKVIESYPNLPKVNMECQFCLQVRMVTSNAASRYVAKISMLRLNIGSGTLRLNWCVLRLSLTSSVQGGRRGADTVAGGGLLLLGQMR